MAEDELISKLQIREEQPSEYQVVFDLNKLSFNNRAEAELVENLIAHDQVLSLVAVLDDKIVGHIMYSKISIMDKIYPDIVLGEALCLAPMCVDPNYHHQGIGTAILKHSIELLRKSEFPFIVVLGHEDYYPKFGFVEAKPRGIFYPTDINSKNWMILELITDSIFQVSGTVKFSMAFDLVS